MTTVDAYADLVSHSAAVEEVHLLAATLATVVTICRDAGGLLPPALLELVEEMATRPSVARRLNDTKAAT
jgi:hypothetical protein